MQKQQEPIAAHHQPQAYAATASHAPILDIDADDVSRPVDPFPGVNDRPKWCVYDDWVTRPGKTKKERPGVYFHGIKSQKGDRDPDTYDSWICGPLHVDAYTASIDDGDHGRLLRWQNVSKNWKQWAMPMQEVAGDGQTVIATLVGDGLEFDRKQRSRLLDYINASNPAKRMHAASATGWHGRKAFVFPDEVIGAGEIWFQATERTAPYSRAGDLQAWKEQVAAHAEGNPLLALGISAALAGVLLERLNIPGAGLHLYGDSSKGKTSLLQAATSVWGGPRYLRTWRATSNGLEGAARMHTDTLLALDEVGEVNPKDLYEAAYSLANGHGKTRANVRGEARTVARWRAFILSTGEVTIASRIAAGGFEAKAGQSLRILDIHTTGRPYGAWDTTRGLVNGAALSDAIRNAAAQHYGHAGPAFVRALLDAPDMDIAKAHQEIIAHMGAADGQETRAARVFALCALAGETAARAGILPWPEGMAIESAREAFSAWRKQRGAAHGFTSEDVAILRALNDFVEKHGDSRFADLHGKDTGRVVVNRAGWRDHTPDGKAVFMLTSAALHEAMPGQDVSRIIAAIRVAKAFAKEGSDKAAVATRVPGEGHKRLYHLLPERLTAFEEVPS